MRMGYVFMIPRSLRIRIKKKVEFKYQAFRLMINAAYLHISKIIFEAGSYLFTMGFLLVELLS